MKRMSFNKYCFSLLLAALVSRSSAGRVPVVDAVTHAPVFTPSSNVLSYPAALSGAAGVGFPSYRVVGHYKDIVLPTAKTDVDIEAEKQSEAQSEFHPKFVIPPETKKVETPRLYRQAPQQFTSPGIGHVNAHGFRLPVQNVEIPAVPQALRVYPHNVDTGPQVFNTPPPTQVFHTIQPPQVYHAPQQPQEVQVSQHTEQSAAQPQYTFHNVESEESQDYDDAPETPSSFDSSPHNAGTEHKAYKEPDHDSDSHEEKDVKTAKYEFMYRVEDHEYHPVSDGDEKEAPSDFGHSEARDGEKTWGRYFVKLPDGRVQTVRYWADHSGYHAEVQFEGKAKHPEPVKKHHHSPVKATFTSNHQNQPQHSSSGEITHLLPSYQAYTGGVHQEGEGEGENVEESSHVEVKSQES